MPLSLLLAMNPSSSLILVWLSQFALPPPGALQTLGTPLLVGRDFTWEELHNQRNVAMVSESFARGEWSTVEGAIGKRVLVGTSQTWQEVIGVVADVYDDGADRPAPLIIYWPARLQDFVAGTLLRRSVNFVMRSERTGTEGFVRETRQAVAEVMPSLPVFRESGVAARRA